MLYFIFYFTCYGNETYIKLKLITRTFTWCYQILRFVHLSSNIQERLRFRGLWPQLYLVLSFFLATHLQNASSSRCLMLFQPNLVRRTTDPSFTKIIAQIWVKGHVGVTKVNDLNCVKKLKQGQMEKLNASSCRSWWKLKSIQSQLCHMTFGFRVKGQNMSFFENLSNAYSSRCFMLF